VLRPQRHPGAGIGRATEFRIVLVYKDMASWPTVGCPWVSSQWFRELLRSAAVHIAAEIPGFEAVTGL
jgi:hypothetical protein